jgi:hypothetical protein
MSTQKAKFELFARLQGLGFTYEEAAALRRIELTLSRWGERECGDGSDWAIERDDATGKPFNVYHGPGESHRYPIADREAGALTRAGAIIAARNARLGGAVGKSWGEYLRVYHQSDPRGCSLYLVRNAEVPAGENIDGYYTRGVAVCA